MSSGSMTPIILRILHLFSMAVWVGSPLNAPGDIRRTLALGYPHAEALIPRIRQSARITMAAGLVTIATGLAVVFALGGFKAVPARIHIGMGLSLLTLLWGALVVDPAWRRIAKTIQARGDLAGAAVLSRRFTVRMGVEHLLRLSVIVLMAWKA